MSRQTRARRNTEPGTKVFEIKASELDALIAVGGSAG
jgi:hypothetical protein